MLTLGIGPESKKKKKPAVGDAEQPPKAQKPPTATVKPTAGDAKKGKRLTSDLWDDYIVVSDSLEGLAPIGLRKPKKEPADSSFNPASDPAEPLEIPSDPEVELVHRVAKRKQVEDAPPPPPPKKFARIGKKSNLDALAAKISPGNKS